MIGPAKQRQVRPRDAATLILYRRSGAGIEVLMGLRHDRHVFLPNHYVFPGGRVDRTDWRVRAAGELAPAVLGSLCRACSQSRARALAAAAIRETFEETGLVLGRPDPEPSRPVPENWRGFFATGQAPALDRLEYVYRAITPPYRPTRFDARFFIAEASALSGSLSGSGELLDLRWFSLEDALRLELPNITSIVLQQIGRMAERTPGSGLPVVTRRYLYGRHTVVEE